MNMDPDFGMIPGEQEINSSLSRLEKIVLESLDFKRTIQRVVDSILYELGYLKLGYRIIVLGLIDEKKKVLGRTSISQTPEAEKAIAGLPFPFSHVDIPLSAKNNYCVKTTIEKKPLITHNWADILTPPLTKDQAVLLQKHVGITTSMVYPLLVQNKAIGMMIFSMVKSEDKVTSQEKELLARFTDIAALAVQNAKLYSKLEDATDELQKANQKLKDLDKMKDEFVSLASHELRTPMTVIKSYLWLALSGKGGEVNLKLKDYLDKAYLSTDRLIRLVNDMLNVSRIESGRISVNMQKISIVKLCQEVVDEVKPKSDEQGVKIIINQAESLTDVIADPDKIKEVVINLIGNSLKFTPKDGEIKISFEIKDNMIITHVADNGEGVAKEDLPKLFQKFGLIQKSYITNKKATQGTGLGLYLSKSIVKIHGGEIWAESEGIKKGATFSFSLKVYSKEDLQKFEKNQNVKEGLGLIHHEI